MLLFFFFKQTEKNIAMIDVTYILFAFIML